MSGYRQPRKINWVSFLFILVGLALIYGLVQFGPPYYRKWRVKGALAESANKIFPRRRQIGSGAGQEFLAQVKSDTRRAMEEIGVEDPNIEVYVTVENKEVTVSVDYTERINHPLVKKVTKLRFRPSNSVEAGPPLVE